MEELLDYTSFINEQEDPSEDNSNVEKLLRDFNEIAKKHLTTKPGVENDQSLLLDFISKNSKDLMPILRKSYKPTNDTIQKLWDEASRYATEVSKEWKQSSGGKVIKLKGWRQDMHDYMEKQKDPRTGKLPINNTELENKGSRIIELEKQLAAIKRELHQLKSNE